MNNISFDNPWLLLVAIPLILAVVIPFCVSVKRDNVNFHNVASVGLHILICICITLALSGMTFEAVITETNVYVLADVSYSSEHSLDEVQDNIVQISQKLPKNSKMGVICFGRDYQLLSDLGEKIPDVKTSSVDRSATDIASALRYAGNLFDDGVIKRIIIITDGAETVSSNNITKVVSSLQDTGVYVDAVYLDNNLPDDVMELQIDAVTASSYTYQNKVESVQVLVSANCGIEPNAQAQGYVSLYKDGTLVDKKHPVLFYNGLNVVTITVPTDEVGTFGYEVRLEDFDESADYSPYNNSYYFTQKVTDERNVLFLGTDASDINAGKRIFGDDSVNYLTVAEKSKIPYTVEELCIYDEIVLCNFDVRKITANDMFLTSLDTLVNDYGKTLITLGNTFIQEDPEDPALKKLSGLLPVTVGNDDQDARLVAIIFDISLSMTKQGRLEIAKSVAKSYLNKLNATDNVMVIGFSDGATPLLLPTPLTQPSAIMEKIDKVTAENGTNLSNALTETHNLINSYKRFREKQVFIISDGNNPASDNPKALSAAQEMSKAGIAVSAIGILEPDGGAFLDSVVNHEYTVSGAYYKGISSANEVDFVISEIEEQVAEVRIDQKCDVAIQRPMDEAVAGIENVNYVNGFWYSSAKSSTQTVLAVKYYSNNVDYDYIPLYAYWSAGGKGKVVSFLSDVAGDWTSGWTAGTGGGAFLENLAVAALPGERVITPFIVELEGAGNSANIRIDASASLQDSSLFTVTVSSPDGLTASKTLIYSSGSYYADFATDAPGTYTVHVEYNYNNLHYEQDTEFIISYCAEYDSFATYNKTGLYSLISENGAILELDELDRLENSESVYTSYVFSFALPLMIACAALFIADIIIRHLRWKDVTSFFSGIFRRRK